MPRGWGGRVRCVAPGGVAGCVTVDPVTASLRRPLQGLVLGAVLAALLATVLVLTLLPAGATSALLVFPALALAAEVLGRRVYGPLPVSVAALPVLGAVCAGEVRAGLLAALVAAVATTVRSGSRRVEQYAFNPAAAVLCTSLAAVVTHPFVGGQVSLLLAGALAGVLYFAVDNALVAQAIGLDQQRPVRSVLREDLTFDLVAFAVYGVLAALLAVLWTLSPVWGVVALLLPPALLHRTHRVGAGAVSGVVETTADVVDTDTGPEGETVGEVEVLESPVAPAMVTVDVPAQHTVIDLAAPVSPAPVSPAPVSHAPVSPAPVSPRRSTRRRGRGSRTCSPYACPRVPTPLMSPPSRTPCASSRRRCRAGTAGRSRGRWRSCAGTAGRRSTPPWSRWPARCPPTASPQRSTSAWTLAPAPDPPDFPPRVHPLRRRPAPVHAQPRPSALPRPRTTGGKSAGVGA